MDVLQLRKWYQERVRKATMSKVDMSLTYEGSTYLETVIRNRRPKVILEMGGGFSTLLIRQVGIGEVYTADHDEKWLGFVQKLLTQRKLPVDRMYTPVNTVPYESLKGRCDLILVDHGPRMETRLNDLPWLCHYMASMDSVLLLDDCRETTRYASQAKGILAGLGWDMYIAEASRSKARAIGVATRR